jgi:hypothetical protein
VQYYFGLIKDLYSIYQRFIQRNKGTYILQIEENYGINEYHIIPNIRSAKYVEPILVELKEYTGKNV